MREDQKLFTDEDAKEFFRGHMKLYRPSNGTEGDMFMERWCRQCEGDRNEDCQILANSFAFDIDDPEYPREWRWNGKGQPECTAFEAKK